MTRAEARLWTHLRTLRPQGFHFRRQAPLEGYILDFVCFSRRLVVEVDGDSHGTPLAAARDARRDAKLEAAGLKTVRVMDGDVLGNISGVMEYILAELDRSSPHPTPPPSASGPPSPSRGGRAHVARHMYWPFIQNIGQRIS
jgi:very-short-patch-repair endonuclease